MTVLAAREIVRYFSIVDSLRRSCRFYDVHVHPYEVIFDEFVYPSDVAGTGIISLDGKRYRAPEISDLTLSTAPARNLARFSGDLRRISLIRLRHLYAHVGKRAFLDQMELSRIDSALLLPIAPHAGGFDERMEWVRDVYGNDGRFWIAGSVPNTIGNADVCRYVSDLVTKHGIRALKCHPVVTGIDMRSRLAKERVEAMLAACRENFLPFVIHSGRNIPFWGDERGNCASLEFLGEIDWSISGGPVVLAHAGLYGCSAPEAEREMLPLLQRILSRHDNVFADVSGIGFDRLAMVLRAVHHGRLLFGSDALYEPQWGGVATLLHALAQSGSPVDEQFVQIASVNPAKTIFRERSCR